MIYRKFELKTLPLQSIQLDYENPRIVTQQPLTSQEAILSYLLEHEDLLSFTKQIAAQGKNPGAERPYVIPSGEEFIVIEGNTRVAAYKILAGLMVVPEEYAGQIPQAAPELKTSLLTLECSVAPDRAALMPIMAKAHFGRGDKAKWGYLGSRQAVYRTYKSGKTPKQLARVFDETPSQITQYIIEYLLYLKALSLPLTPEEKATLEDPSVAFNPPVRFLQTAGHKDQLGIAYDYPNMKIDFTAPDSEHKFQHLIRKLVLNTGSGLGATASYASVFADYVPAESDADEDATKDGAEPGGTSSPSGPVGPTAATAPGTSPGKQKSGPKKNRLFSYPAKRTNLRLQNLMKEAQNLSTEVYPASSTLLLRTVVELLFKLMIDEFNANPSGKSLTLQDCIGLMASNAVTITKDEKKLIKDFGKNHLDYLNLGSHANTIPNRLRLESARDAIEPFVEKYV